MHRDALPGSRFLDMRDTAIEEYQRLTDPARTNWARMDFLWLKRAPGKGSRPRFHGTFATHGARHSPPEDVTAGADDAAAAAGYTWTGGR